jgi:hypothetical protein
MPGLFPASTSLPPEEGVDHRDEPGDDEGGRVAIPTIPKGGCRDIRTIRRGLRFRPPAEGNPAAGRAAEEKPDVQDASLAVAFAAAAAAPAHADIPISNNGLDANGLSANAIEAHAALNGRVVGIELPSTTGEAR